MPLSVTLRQAIQPLVYGLPSGLERRLLFTYFNRRIPRFRHPVSFNDKVNWRILNDRRSILEWTCDKLAMKEYAASASIANLHIPRTLWSGVSVEGLRNVALPADWVLKPNHRSGLIFFGSGIPEYGQLSDVTRTWLDSFEAEKKREWAYSTARPMLLVEELLGNPGAPPPDYKFYVFDGEVAMIGMDVDRYADHTRRLYSPTWSPLEIELGPKKLSPVLPPPANLSQMLEIAGQLGRLYDFMRVDLYEVEGEVVFGELTPYSSGGLERFVPASFDIELGKKWKLPKL